MFIAFKQLIYPKSAALDGSLHLTIRTSGIAGAGARRLGKAGDAELERGVKGHVFDSSMGPLHTHTHTLCATRMLSLFSLSLKMNVDFRNDSLVSCN